MEGEKQYQLIVMFNSKEPTVFGGIQAQSVSMVVDSKTRDKVFDLFYKQSGVISVSLPDGLTRHINTRGILYIDEVEVSTENNEKVEESNE